MTRVAIVGGGPGGTASALFLARQGIESIIIEKAKFPRFHIGESLTGECGRLVRDLGLEPAMMKQQFPVKHGVKVYGPTGDNTFWIPVMGVKTGGELVDSTTWQVSRGEFDRLLSETARKQGIQIIHGQALKPLFNQVGHVCGVRVRLADGRIEDIESEVLVDASGQSTFLSTAGVTGPKERGNYDRQVAIFSHVRGAVRDPEPEAGNTLIFYQKRNFWAWFIPISPEVTSVGIVVPSDYYRKQAGDKQEFFLREMTQIHANLAERLQAVELIEPVRAASNYSYQIKNFAGKGYLCVGDSHRFVDPIFSFGLYFSMMEAKKGAKAIRDYLQGKGDGSFCSYQEECERGQDVIQDLIDAFWEFPIMFAFCAHYRYEDDFIHMFAGRVYQDGSYAGLEALRTAMAHSRAQAKTAVMEEKV